MKRNICLTKQRGATLIVALIVLLALTLLSTAFLQNNALQLKMTANQQDVELAFQEAEDQLLSAERMLEARTKPPSIHLYSDLQKNGQVVDSRADSDVLPAALLNQRDQWFSRAWKAEKKQKGTSVELIEVRSDEIGISNDYLAQSGLDRFRQISLSTGVTGKTEVILVTEYQKRFR